MTNARAGIGMALAAGLLAAGCGGGGYGGNSGSMPTSGTTAGTTASPAAAADVVVTISGMSFTPSSVAVQAGQTIAWKNNDAIAHTATQDGGGFDTGLIAAGATSRPITITDPGTLKYHCAVHPGMTGAINGATGGGNGY